MRKQRRTRFIVCRKGPIDEKVVIIGFEFVNRFDFNLSPLNTAAVLGIDLVGWRTINLKRLVEMEEEEIGDREEDLKNCAEIERWRVRSTIEATP
ncbi:hypothetical protein RHMOL_Rhmol02G0108700 [Rhododendron molle]|uniref:Uncharacterized protein n=1 Tax=Rhododendron molle TaxID=49168 RepID=A0ACC0PP59_RHOML|nr:hypothetical protein RHMOL_Rhmol02G0108700 [Rhododendron molle]